MSPEERVQAYQEAVDVLNNYVAQEAAKIGNSQASLGTMAERVARPSGMTSGLANYTYNRTLRPTIDTLAANLTTQGYSAGLNKQLSDAIMAAKQRYEDAKNAYTVASTTPKTTSTGGGGWTESMGSPKAGETAPEAPATQGATNQTVATNNAINAMNQFAALTGGGQMQEPPIGTRFSYTLNGDTHTGYVYAGQGGEIDGMSFTKSGLNNYLNNIVRNGGTVQNHLGNPVNYSVWKVQYKIN